MSQIIRKSTVGVAAAIAVTGLAMALPAQAAVVVSWQGSDYSVSGTNGGLGAVTWVPGEFGGDPNTPDSRAVREFSLVESYNPTHSSYDDTLDSAVFYGGSLWQFNDQDAQAAATLSHSVTQHHYLNLGFRDVGNDHESFAAHALLWTQDGFLNGADSQTVSFDGDSYLNFTEHTIGHNSNVRFLIRVGNDQYYVSNTNAADASLTLSGQNLLNEMWAEYDPNDDLVFNTSTPFDTATSALTDITGFGLYSFGSGDPTNFRMGGFEVNANAVIPEPASIGLVLGGLGLMLSRRRARA